MTTRINLTPFAEEKQKAVVRINGYYHSIAISNLHREQDWKYKREAAAAVLNGAQAPDEFSSEAAMRTMDVTAYAELVLSKGDPVPERSLARQKALTAVEKATTLGQLATILESLPHG